MKSKPQRPIMMPQRYALVRLFRTSKTQPQARMTYKSMLGWKQRDGLCPPQNLDHLLKNPGPHRILELERPIGLHDYESFASSSIQGRIMLSLQDCQNYPFCRQSRSSIGIRPHPPERPLTKDQDWKTATKCAKRNTTGAISIGSSFVHDRSFLLRGSITLRNSESVVSSPSVVSTMGVFWTCSSDCAFAMEGVSDSMAGSKSSFRLLVGLSKLLCFLI